MVFGVGNGSDVLMGLVEVVFGGGIVGEAVGAGEGFVGVAYVEWEQFVLFADLEATAGVIEGGLRTFQDGVDAGDLPLADAKIGGVADLAPVITGSVCAVDHGIRIGSGAVGLLHERPRLVEEVHGEAAVNFRGDGSGHGRRINGGARVQS